MHKSAENTVSQQVKKPSEKKRSVLDRHVPRGLDDRTGDYSTYPKGVNYLVLVEHMKIDPYFSKRVQL